MAVMKNYSYYISLTRERVDGVTEGRDGTVTMKTDHVLSFQNDSKTIIRALKKKFPDSINIELKSFQVLH